MKVLKLPKIDECVCELDGKKFTVRGMTREEAINFRKEMLEIQQIEDPIEREERMLELEKMLLQTCIEDEEAFEMLMKASQKAYDMVLQKVFELSGLGERGKN